MPPPPRREVEGLVWLRDADASANGDVLELAVVAVVTAAADNPELRLEQLGSGARVWRASLHRITQWRSVDDGKELHIHTFAGGSSAAVRQGQVCRLRGEADSVKALQSALLDTCTELAKNHQPRAGGDVAPAALNVDVEAGDDPPAYDFYSPTHSTRYSRALLRRQVSRRAFGTPTPASPSPGRGAAPAENDGPGAATPLEAEERDKLTGADMLLDEMIILGKTVFDMLTPSETNKHPRIFVVSCVIVTVATTFYCMDPDQGFSQTVDIDTMFDHGARSDPHIYVRKEGWRHVTSLVPHNSFAHLAGNMVLLLSCGWMLEHRYGWYRDGPIYMVSGISGNMYSATFEDCKVVAGASGACFGLVAVIIGDLLVNKKRRMKFYYLRWFFVLFSLFCMTTSPLSEESVSHWSHIGGLAAGLALAIMFLPRLSTEDVESISAWVSLLFLAFTFVVLPLNLYATTDGFTGQPKACQTVCEGKYCCGVDCLVAV